MGDELLVATQEGDGGRCIIERLR